jgi:CheY-like chemotaxis protein
MRAVIIEDDADAATQLRHSIEDLGYPVVGVASSFAAGVDMLMTARDVGLAVIDLDLGHDDARDRIGALLVNLAASRAMRVAVTIGAGAIPDHLKGAALLVKPYSDEQLASVLASIAPRAPRHRLAN